MAKRRSENDVVRSVLEYLRARGAVAVRVHSGKMRWNYKRKDGTEHHGMMKLADEGTSDILGVYHGVAIALECKLPGAATKKSRREAQKDFLRRWNEAGGRGYFQVESVDDAKKILDSIDDERHRRFNPTTVPERLRG